MRHKNAIETDEPDLLSESELLEWINSGKGATMVTQFLEVLKKVEESQTRKREKLAEARMAKWKTVHDYYIKETTMTRKLV